LLDDADGPSDARATRDADGMAEPRGMQDAGVIAEGKHWQDAEGPADGRKLEDAEMSGGEQAPGEHALGSDEVTDEVSDEVTGAAKAAAEVEVDHRSQEELVDDIVHHKVQQAELTPWAISVHLEHRISKLNEMTETAKAQLEDLEASSKKLEKRLSSL
jgi:hypothetical protein